MPPLTAIAPSAWLQAVAHLVLTAPSEDLRETWNVTPCIEQSRNKMMAGGTHDPRVVLGTAQAFVDMFLEGGDESLLDQSLVGTAQALAVDVSSRRFAIVGMTLLMSPPLAHAETFIRLCHRVGAVPCLG